MKDIAIAITGMSCSHCLNSVNRALTGVPGVELRSLRIGRADLRLDEDPVTLTRLQAALEDAGYKLEGVIGN